MSDKILLFLFICLLGLQIGCQTGQATSADRLAPPITEDPVSDEEIQKLFIEAGLGDGDGNLNKLLALPREQVVAVVRKLRDQGIRKGEPNYEILYRSDDLRLKSAYFLWKLDIDAEANEKLIVEAAKNKDLSKKFEAVSWLCPIVGKGKKEYLPIIFQATPRADGGYAQGLQGFFIGEILSSPKPFLLYLSKENSKVRKSVYELLALTDEMWGREKMDRVNAAVNALKADEETKTIAEEFTKEVGKRQ